MALVLEKITGNKYVILYDIAVAVGASMTVAAPAGLTYIVQNIACDKAFEVRQVNAATLDLLINECTDTDGGSVEFSELYAHSSAYSYLSIKNTDGAATMQCVVHAIETQ